MNIRELSEYESFPSDHVIVNDVPGVWLLSPFFIGIGLLFIFMPFVAENRNEVPVWVSALSVIMGMIAALSGFGLFKAFHRIRVVCSPLRCEIRIERFGFRRRSIEVYEYKQVDQAVLADHKDSDGDKVYSVELRLISGKKIPLVSSTTLSKKQGEKEASKINLALHKAGIPSRITRTNK